MKPLAKMLIAAACLSGLTGIPAQAAGARLNADTTMQARQPTLVDQSKRDTASRVARLLEDRHFVAVLQRHLSQNEDKASLNSLLADYGVTSGHAMASARLLSSIDQRVREYKGIAADTGSLLELRLYAPDGYAGRIDWRNLLVAYPPSKTSDEWGTVEAFDRHGRSHALDGRTPPSVPVLIAGIDERADLQAGTAYVNRALRDAGLQPVTLQAADQSIAVTTLAKIHLKKDHEPWISGAAEIYAIVSGVQPDQAKAALTVIDMPYLDHDGKTYWPNQVMFFWDSYRYAAANFQLFEHDDNTSYRDLAIALSQGVTSILGTFTPGYAVIGQVASAILRVLPAHWYSNDDDYVDSFYTLEKGRYYNSRRGAAGNATISMTPRILGGR
jgi:hypothetical protein